MKTAIRTENSPAAIGPYSQAVRAGSLVFVSGQLPLSPTGAQMPSDIAAQAEQVFDNMAAVLGAANLTMEDVVRTTVYLSDLEDFAAVNAIYSRRVSGAVLPARSTIEVSALPQGALIEIDAIAFAGGMDAS